MTCDVMGCHEKRLNTSCYCPVHHETRKKEARRQLNQGVLASYDAHRDVGVRPAIQDSDWTHRAARAIMCSLAEKPGIGGLAADYHERVEVVQNLADIIRTSFWSSIKTRPKMSEEE